MADEQKEAMDESLETVLKRYALNEVERVEVEVYKRPAQEEKV